MTKGDVVFVFEVRGKTVKGRRNMFNKIYEVGVVGERWCKVKPAIINEFQYRLLLKILESRNMEIFGRFSKYFNANLEGRCDPLHVNEFQYALLLRILKSRNRELFVVFNEYYDKVSGRLS